MNGFNKVILAGNLTRDPEMRFTPTGTAICKFGLAVNRKWKDQSGQAKEEVVFIDVDSFGRTAEVIGEHLKKGRPILLEGRLKLDQWDDKQSGQKRSKHGVVLESFTFLDSGNGGERSESAPNRGIDKSDVPPTIAANQPEEDDVPF